VNDGSYSRATVHVLVVCTANVARSPLATAMLRESLTSPGLTVTSAGTHAREGDHASEEAVTLGEQRGLDLSPHRSAPVTAELVRQADLILTMTEEHRDHCSSLAPGAGARTFAFREFVRLLEEVAQDRGPVAMTDRLLWLRSQAHFARPHSSRPEPPEDIADPVGGSGRVWRELGTTLDDLVEQFHAAVARSV